MRRLLSFLGVGSGTEGYKRCRYRMDGFVSGETRFVQRAIFDAAKSAKEPFDEVVLFCTKKARDKWTADDVIAKEISESARLVDIPDGKNSSELWTIFNAVAQELGGSSPEPGMSIHMDVTHGFRVQPLIGLAALDFVRSEWQRRRIESPPEVRITYGAMDAAEDDPDGCTPIWDLSELLTAGRWNSALTAVLAYGRGEELETLTKSLGDRAAREARARNGSSGEQGAAREAEGTKLGAAVKAFTDDLCTGRLPFLFKGSAPALARTLESDGVRALREKLPVLGPTLDWLNSRVASLQADSVVATEAGARAMLAYAQLCGELQRFAEQAAALREGLVTLFALRLPWPDPLRDAQTKDMSKQRKEIDEAFGRLGAKLEEGEASAKLAARAEAGGAVEVLRLGHRVADLRNDVEHLAIRSEPRPAKKVISALDEYTKAAMRFVEEASAEGGRSAMPCFLNLSNHPVRSWSEAQRTAAIALGFGEPVDLVNGMPIVDPTIDCDGVSALAHAIVERAMAQRPAGAHVATEHGLTALLVAELQRRGVRCFTATTERVAREEAQPDGAVRLTHEFRFVRWREYARICRD